MPARTPEDAFPWPLKSLASPLCAVRDGNFLVGAFEGQQMVGQAGFFRLESRRERHKGRIWGVYVTETARGKGVGKPC